MDLGWKLSATLDGWGGGTLLDAYETERRCAHEIVLDAAEANHAVLANQLVIPHLEEDSAAGRAARREVAARIERHKRAEFHARGIVLGTCYLDSPVIVDGGDQARWERSVDYVPSAIPGCRAPHRWLADGRSLFDRFGAGFTLLRRTTTAGRTWPARARDGAQRRRAARDGDDRR